MKIISFVTGLGVGAAVAMLLRRGQARRCEKCSPKERKMDAATRRSAYES